VVNGNETLILTENDDKMNRKRGEREGTCLMVEGWKPLNE